MVSTFFAVHQYPDKLCFINFQTDEKIEIGEVTTAYGYYNMKTNLSCGRYTSFNVKALRVKA